jgi:hypothetical protein
MEENKVKVTKYPSYTPSCPDYLQFQIHQHTPWLKGSLPLPPAPRMIGPDNTIRAMIHGKLYPVVEYFTHFMEIET